MPLSRDEVIEGSLRLLDEVGLDALSMRRVADALDVQAGAIYYHFKDKQDLYDAMVDALLGGLLEPPLEGSWEEQISELSRRLVASLSSRRDAARLATLTLKPGPNGLAVSETFLRVLRQAGLPRRATIWASAVLGYYLLGYVTDMQATESAKARGLTAIAKQFRKQLDPEEHRELLAMIAGGDTALEQMMSPREFRARFEFGLRVILKGLEATRPPPSRPKRPARRR